ncbi:MAG: TetR family transcriptional regulator [Actinobacteria bacterium]|nr:TetR family transcriptional regulator [Actinomycetota bacterium]
MAQTLSGERSSTPRRRAAPVSRQQTKEQTRQALLAAALKLLSQHSFDSISLREVTREAGVSPTAFYRHFEDMEELGLVLVEESLGTLRVVIRELRAEASEQSLELAKTVRAIAEYVLAHQLHLRFIARERWGGRRRLRREIRREIQLFTDELAVDLAGYDALARWSMDDRRVLAGLLTELVVRMSIELLDTRADEREEIIQQTLRQMRLAIVGVPNWKPREPRGRAPAGRAVG